MGFESSDEPAEAGSVPPETPDALTRTDADGPGPSRGVEVSVIVPAYNEVENIEPLLAELEANLGPGCEVVLVDDGSTDGTREAAENLKPKYPFLKVCGHRRNQGKTAAILTALPECEGGIISILDADMQYDPEDVVRQVAKIREGFDLVGGIKRGKYEKRFVSAIYNRLARILFGVKVHDINALKTFRREVLESIRLRKDWHRYIVPLAAARGFSITEIPVLLRPRLHGAPKFSGSFRVLIGLFDMVAVGFQLSFMRKPMLYFGVMGTGALFTGFVIGVITVILRLFRHGFRPLLYLVILLVVAGLVLFAAGLLGESLAGVNDRLDKMESLLAGRNPEDEHDPHRESQE